MLTSMIVRWLGLAVLAVVVAAAVTLWRRAARNPLFLPAGKRKTGPLQRWRIACGILGAALVVAVAIGTWQTVRASYTLSPALSDVTLRVPTRSLGLASAPPGTTLKDVRLLATLVVLDARAAEVRPVYVKQFDLQWPQVRYATETFRLGELSAVYTVSVQEVEHQSGHGAAGLVLRGQQHIEWSRTWDTWGYTKEFGRRDEGPVYALPAAMFAEFARKSPLSVTPPTVAEYSCALWIVPVAQDDTLEALSLEQFVQLHEADLKGTGLYGLAPHATWRADWGTPAGGAKLAERLGWTVWVLLAAAGLLAMLFRRTDLALAGMLLVMVLYVAGLDRTVLAYDLSRVEDSAAPLDVRLVAASRVPATFFYERTAALRVAQLSVRRETPAELRGRLREIRQQMGLDRYF
jgi:hypothetical protein